MSTETAHGQYRAVYFISTIATLGSFLVGCGTGVVSGALLFLTSDFHLNILQQDLAVSIALLGALAGAIGASAINDFMGRRNALLLTSIIFALGSLLTGFAPDFNVYLLSRVIAGFGIGAVSSTVPIYISEIAPTHLRGRLITFHQLALAAGILASYVVNLLFAQLNAGWRPMFLATVLPAFLLLLCYRLLPETPRWLGSKNRWDEAHQSMLRLKIPQHLIEDELLTMHNMNTAAEQTKESPWHLIFRPGLRNALIVGVGLGLIQQLIGINSVIYYATTIFEIAGFHTVDTAIIATCSVGLMNVIATFVASLLMDRLGRRPLLLGGTVGAVIALFMLGALFAFQINNAGIWTILFLFLYIIALALSFGPISWVMSAEIFPNEVRAAGSSLSTFSNWGANFLISSTFLPMVNGVGIGGTFWSYAVIGVFSFAFCWFLVPETKGRSLEDIAYYWMHHRHWPDEESRPSQEKAHN